MGKTLPDLSRFEWQCLKLLWDRSRASARDLHQDLGGAPSYSTVRKIIERLEEKGAVERAGLEGKAWIYRPAVSRSRMIRREVRRFLESVFDGTAAPLVTELFDMNALSVDELRHLERRGNEDRSGRETARKGKRRARRPRGGQEEGGR